MSTRLRKDSFDTIHPRHLTQGLLHGIARQLGMFREFLAPREQLRLDITSPTGPRTLGDRWINIRKQFFPERKDLDCYRVHWSDRKQKRCLASCNVLKKRVSVAAAMAATDCEPYLDALLYHEMCHAVLGVPREVNGRRILHGREFKELERRNPAIPELDRWIESGGWKKVALSHRKNNTRRKNLKKYPLDPTA